MTGWVKLCSSRVFAAWVMLTLNPRDARKKEMSPAVTTKLASLLKNESRREHEGHNAASMTSPPFVEQELAPP